MSLVNNYIIFGAGEIGKQIAELLGKEKISFFIDNDNQKQNSLYLGIKVISIEEAKKIKDKFCVIIAVSDSYKEDIKTQLESNGITNFRFYNDVKTEYIKNKINNRMNYIDIYNKAILWILKNTKRSEGIAVTNKSNNSYPEVTGYFIPTLINWGYKNLAIDYAKWLCSIQKSDGSWFDPNNINPYVFDTAQVLKGLIAVRKIYPDVDDNILRGCGWILSNIDNNGRLTTPDMSAWGNDIHTCSELVHLYCLSPLKDAGEIFGKIDYINSANKVLDYYKKEHYNEIMNFDLLSHFYAYVMEAMIDMNEYQLVKEAMNKIAIIQKESGAVPAYNNVDWVCSTGLFQFSLVWFRLGEIEKGNKAFEYACKLQNKTGGWYGSYISEENPDEINTYFPDSEISWANKYFLDALYYKNIAEFNRYEAEFFDKISKDDGRYICIRNAVHSQNTLNVLDIGCGKGRYLKNLLDDEPQNQYYASDISENLLAGIKNVSKKFGTLTDIPFEDNMFDVVYTCEALEHAIDIESAVREMARVVKSGGRIVIIDKNIEELGALEICDWEQWFDINELSNILRRYCSEVILEKNISYNNISDNLFICVSGIVK